MSWVEERRSSDRYTKAVHESKFGAKEKNYEHITRSQIRLSLFDIFVC